MGKLRSALSPDASRTKLGRILDGLSDGDHRVLHDVDLARDVVPHVVVGPSGIYAIVGRSWRGRVRMDDGGRIAHGPFSGEGARRQALDKATSVRRRLAACGLDHVVIAVIALPAGHLERAIDLRTVHVVEGERLVSWVRRRSAKLQRREIEDVCLALAPRPGGIGRPIA